MALSNRTGSSTAFWLGNGEKEALQDSIAEYGNSLHFADYLNNSLGEALNNLNNMGLTNSSVGNNALADASIAANANYWGDKMAMYDNTSNIKSDTQKLLSSFL